MGGKQGYKSLDLGGDILVVSTRANLVTAVKPKIRLTDLAEGLSLE